MSEYTHLINGKQIPFTEQEITTRKEEEKAWNDDKPNRQIKQIRDLRNRKLSETDYLANSDVTMPDNIKTWRQSLRDLPQNNTTESEYDALLARDDDGNLTNAIWSKP